MNLRELTEQERRVAHSTIGSHAFYAIVVDALIRRKPLSVIRISDGEKAAWNYAIRACPNALLECLDEGFRQRFGCEGISCGEILKRIRSAIEECGYLSPSNGFFNAAYDVLDICLAERERDSYVDGWFPYAWSNEMKQALMKQAKQVCVINRDRMVSDRMRSACWRFSTSICQVTLNDWQEAEQVRQIVASHDAPLVLMSAGLASKYIGPRIAIAGNKVVLDIGQAADVWL